MVFVALFTVGGWAIAIVMASRPWQASRRQGRDDLRLASWTDRLFILPFYPAVDRLSGLGLAMSLVTGVQSRLALLAGSSPSGEAGRRFLAESLGYGFGAASGVSLLAVIADEPLMAAIAAAGLALLPAMRVRRLYRQAEERRREMVSALPALLGKLTLLVGAGETVQGALFRCADAGDANNALYRELRRSVHAIRNGESFQQAMERFGRRCGVQEAAVFTAAVLLNYRKGGDRFVMSLKELSYGLWDKRKAIARMRGEEAASKLSFPLVVVFLVLMVLIGSPAILSM